MFFNLNHVQKREESKSDLRSLATIIKDGTRNPDYTPSKTHSEEFIVITVSVVSIFYL
jgi:hypothetical protein